MHKTQHNANSGLKKKNTQQSKNDFCGDLPFPAISIWSWWTEVLFECNSVQLRHQCTILQGYQLWDRISQVVYSAWKYREGINSHSKLYFYFAYGVSLSHVSQGEEEDGEVNGHDLQPWLCSLLLDSNSVTVKMTFSSLPIPHVDQDSQLVASLLASSSEWINTEHSLEWRHEQSFETIESIHLRVWPWWKSNV